MFEFKPEVSLETIKEHVAEVKAARITLRTGDEIYKALIQEFAAPGSTEYASAYSAQKRLTECSVRLWSRFKRSLQLAMTTLFKDGKVYGIESSLTGIMNHQYRFPEFRDQLNGELATYQKIAQTSERPDELYRVLQYAAEVAPHYTWAHCNSVDSSTDISIGDIVMPKDGLLYSPCFALLPETERALQLTKWLLATKEAENQEDATRYMAYYLYALILPDDGKAIEPVPANDHK